MLVTKESNNIYMRIQNNSNVDRNQLCIKMNGEVYNQLILSVNMHLHETNTSSPYTTGFEPEFRRQNPTSSDISHGCVGQQSINKMPITKYLQHRRIYDTLKSDFRPLQCRLSDTTKVKNPTHKCRRFGDAINILLSAFC